MQSTTLVRRTLPAVRRSTMRPYSSRRKYRKTTRTTSRATTFNSANVGQSSSRMPKIEYKYNDISLNAVIYYMYTTVGFIHLTGMVQGASPSMRVGTRVSIKGVYINAIVSAPATQTNAEICRLMLLCDRQANGQAPSAGDIGITSASSMYNPNGKPRFFIMWDKHFSIAVQTQDNGARFLEKYIHFRQPLVVQYNLGVSGLVNDVNSNSIFLIFCGTATATGTAPRLTGYVRLLYTDD